MISKYLTLLCVFILNVINIAHANTVTTSNEVTSDCGGANFSSSSGSNSLTISGDGNLYSTGVTPTISRPTSGNYGYSIVPDASKAICIASTDLQGITIDINTNNQTTGINQTYASRHAAAISVERGGYLALLHLQSGTITSDDTAVFLTTSSTSNDIDLEEEKITKIIIEEGASIIGHRNAIRQDELTSIAQTGYKNDGSAQEGYLMLEVENSGTIASNPALVSIPLEGESTSDGYAFYIGTDNRVKKNIKIKNNSSGNITGMMVFGTLTTAQYNANITPITSDVYFSNSGNISSSLIKADINTNMTFINEASGVITLEANPLSSTYTYYEVSDDDGGAPQTITHDQPKRMSLFSTGESSFTNYGTFNGGNFVGGGINSSGKSHFINLEGGTFTGDIVYAGTLTFGDNLDQYSTTGSVYARKDFVSDQYQSLLNIGQGTYNIQQNDYYDGSLTLNGLEDQDLDGIIDNGSHTISVDRSDNGTFGRLNFAGKAIIQDGVKLNINLSDAYSYLKDGTTYTIIDGEHGSNASTSDVTKVADENISIDGVVGNQRGIITYSTQVEDGYIDGEGVEKFSNLILRVNRASASEISDDVYVQNLYTAIDDIGSSATGSLKDLQQDLDESQTYAQAGALLKSTEPINDGNIEVETMTPIRNFIQSANDRIDQFFGRDINSTIEIAPSVPQNDHQTIELTQKDVQATQSFPFKDSAFDEFEGYSDLVILNDCYQNLTKNIKYVLVDQFTGTGVHYSNLITRIKACYRQRMGMRYILVNSDNNNVKYRGKILMYQNECVKNDTNSCAVESGISFGDQPKNITVWGQGFDTVGRQQSRAMRQGFSSNTSGLAFGIDKKLGKNALIGAAISYANTTIKSSNATRNITMDSYQFNIYGAKKYNNHYFWDAIAGLSLNDYHSLRAIANMNLVANAKYSGRNYFARLRGGKIYHHINNSSFSITPELSTTFLSSLTNAHQEQGADTLNLRIAANSDEFLELRAGINVDYDDILRKKYDLKYRSHASYGYNFLNKGQKTLANFVNYNTQFSTANSKVDSGSFRLGLGIDMKKLYSSTILSLDYILDKRISYISHSALAKIKYGF